MVTADDQATSVVEALRRGANDYLIKPINLPVAAARIRTQLALCELVRLKDEFLSFASHDLKKPLMLAEDVLQQLTTMFVSRSPLVEVVELIELLLHSNRNMQNVVRGFLDANVHSEGIAPRASHIVSMNTLVQSAVAENSSYARKKHIGLHARLDPHNPVVLSDEFRIKQVLDNLVGNALKFSPAHSVTVVSTRIEDAAVWVEICDGGPGLSDQDQARLFQKGVRLGNTPTGDEESSGVGLALCKELMSQIGGKIGARNNPQGGTTFWFRLDLPK